MESLDNLAREGARKMISSAQEVAVERCVQSLRHLRDEQGHALVVRNGTSHHERSIILGAGSIKMKTPRVNDRRPDQRFLSQTRGVPLVVLVTLGVQFPNGQSDLLQSEPEPDHLFMRNSRYLSLMNL